MQDFYSIWLIVLGCLIVGFGMMCCCAWLCNRDKLVYRGTHYAVVVENGGSSDMLKVTKRLPSELQIIKLQRFYFRRSTTNN